jgi:biopolymer transport protein ExbB/TolQ
MIKYIFSTLLISLIGWSLFIAINEWMPKELDKVYLHVIHIPSILFIIMSWIIAEKLLNSNQTSSKKSVIKAEHDETNLNNILLNIESKDNKKIEEAYNSISSLGGIFEKFRQTRLNGESHQDFAYRFEKHYAVRSHELNERASHLSFVSTVLPMLGMVGTLVGLMMMASGLENSDSITSQEGLKTEMQFFS